MNGALYSQVFFFPCFKKIDSSLSKPKVSRERERNISTTKAIKYHQQNIVDCKAEVNWSWWGWVKTDTGVFNLYSFIKAYEVTNVN